MINKSNLPSFFFMALLGVFINGCSSRSNNACVDVTLGQVHLKVPQQNMTPTTPHKDNSGNFIFAFDSSVPGIECVGWCNDLFVNISSTNPTPEQNWIYREPKFTGRTSGNYRVYLDRITNIYDPLWEILVPSDALHPQDEYYVCDPEGQGLKSRGVNPLCTITVVTKSGLVARFSIRRKVLIKAREAASFVIQSIDQFSENHIKGICK